MRMHTLFKEKEKKNLNGINPNKTLHTNIVKRIYEKSVAIRQVQDGMKKMKAFKEQERNSETRKFS